MALSGSFTTGETQGLSNIYVEGVWSVTQDISANESRVTLSAYLWHWELSNRSQPLTLSVDGQTYTMDTPVINTGDVWQRTFLGSHTFTLTHAGDGTKTVSMSVDYNAKITYSGKDLQHISQSSSGIVLDTIPRASAISSVPSSVTAGNALSVGITPASSAFNHKLVIRAGTQSYTVSLAAGVKTASYTIPVAWANEFPASMSGTGKLTLETYNGSAKIGTAETSWTLAVPAYSMTASLGSAISGNSTAASWGAYIKGLTKAELTGTAATSYGASIRSLSISGGGFSQSNAGGSLHFTTGYLNTAGSISFVLTASDSRGKSVSKSVTISVSDYAQPSLSSVNTFRSDGSKNANPSGTYITAAATFGCSSVNGKNKIQIATVQYKLVTAATYTTGISSLASNTPTIFGDGKIDVNASYDVLYTIQDALGGKATAMAAIPTQEVPLSFYPKNKGLTVGGVAEEEGFVSKYNKNKIKGDLTVEGPIYSQGDLVGSRIRTITIPDGADLNDYRDSGFYASRSTQNTNIKNVPTPTKAFELMVTGITDSGQYATQIAKDYNSNRCWIRTQINYQTPWMWREWTEISMEGHMHSYLPLAGGTVSGPITAPYIVTGGYAMSINGTTYNSGAAYCRTLKMAGSTNGNDQYFVQVDSDRRLRIGTQLNAATTPTWHNGIGPAIQLWSGSMSSGSITVNAAKTCTTIIIVGIPGTSSGWATTAIPTALLGSSALPLMISDDTYWFGLNVSASGNNVVIAARNGSGTIKYVFGV